MEPQWVPGLLIRAIASQICEEKGWLHLADVRADDDFFHFGVEEAVGELSTTAMQAIVEEKGLRLGPKDDLRGKVVNILREAIICLLEGDDALEVLTFPGRFVLVS